MIIGFDRKFELHSLSIFTGFTYWLRDHFRINWLEPAPGVGFVESIGVLGEIFGNYLDIRIAARGLFTSIAVTLHDEWLKGKRALFPTIKDVYDRNASTRYPVASHLARHQETLDNRLLSLHHWLGDTISSHRQLDWNKLVNGDWAISLSGLPTDIQNLFITVTVAKILQYRMANNLRSSQLEVLFVLDEAGSLFKRWYEHQEGTYWLSECLQQSREYGIGFLISSQSLNIADSVLANTATKILAGGVGLGADLDTFGSAVGLTAAQKDYLRQNLKPGVACVKDPRYPHPFVVEVPRIA